MTLRTLTTLCACLMALSPMTTVNAQPTLPALPTAITSFGAATLDGKLYVYGGHTGDAHEYYYEAQSNKLLVLDPKAEKSQWKELSTGERLQGLGMVAYRDDLIILGGFTAKNKEGEKKNLVSSSRVQAFNVKDQRWRNLPDLPEARSSHDAAIIGSVVYVVGGWNMQAEKETQWHHTAWSLDLSKPEVAWSPLPDPPFVRRALATIAHADKLFVVGGMNEQGAPTREACVYDPASKTWTEIAPILGQKAMAGFGAAGWSVNGKLVVSTYEGDLEYWNADKKAWEPAGRTSGARFFHRLLPLSNQTLVAIGGANMEQGKFLELEQIPVH